MVKPVISILAATALIVVFGVVMVMYAPSGKKLAGEQVYNVKMKADRGQACLLYTSPSPRDRQKSRMPSSA